MPPPQLFVNITLPTGRLPSVDRTFQMSREHLMAVHAGELVAGLTRNVTVQFGPGGSTSAATFSDQVNWPCTGTVSPSTPWGSMVQLTINAHAAFRIVIPLRPYEPDFATLNISTTFMVRLFPADCTDASV